ncbi:MAG: hypothetical protein ABEK29_08635, partial [Bradymonadaceae bacterium]
MSLDRFADSAREVLESMRERLVELERGMFLPLDLLVVLIDRGHDELTDLVAEGSQGMVESRDVPRRLRTLAEEIEDKPTERGPVFRRSSFSRGFSRILREAWEQASTRGDDEIDERDLARSVTWRVEAVESASVRCAIRRLSEGK